MRVLITGGMGFVGSSLALQFREEFPRAKITAFDNLHRRGSELNIARLKERGIDFVHGDIRSREDLYDLGEQGYDLFVEASAEPSVHAGTQGSPDYVINTNLTGTINCLEYGRRRVDQLVFLSTSRIYSIGPLREIATQETEDRLVIAPDQNIRGVSGEGICEEFPFDSARSIYGTTKLASEFLVQEYVETYEMNAVINRCGVIAGPGQFGKVDQGVFTLWVANHYFGKALAYHGFGGTGKQVRDLLHPNDLYSLIRKQSDGMKQAKGKTYNVGGGTDVSVSLKELTRICQEVTGNEVELGSKPETAAVDIPLYISDYRKVKKELGWQPEKSVSNIVSDIHSWLKKDEAQLKSLFG